MISINYLSKNPSKGFISLFLSRIVVYISIGFFGLFIPIFIFTTFNKNITIVASFYLLTSVFYFLLLPLGAKFINYFGMKKSLICGNLANVMFLLCLSLIEIYNPYIAIIPVAIFLIVSRILYWVPYHTGFAKFSNKENRSREIALRRVSISFIGILTPMIAGFIIAKFSYSVLFFMGIILYFLSIIPLLNMPKINELFSWTYKETWENLLSKKIEKLFLLYMQME